MRIDRCDDDAYSGSENPNTRGGGGSWENRKMFETVPSGFCTCRRPDRVSVARSRKDVEVTESTVMPIGDTCLTLSSPTERTRRPGWKLSPTTWTYWGCAI